MKGLKTCECGEPTYSNKCSLCLADEGLFSKQDGKGSIMSNEKPKLTVIPSSDQRAMGSDLMQELRDVINAPKYDHMTISTVIGVLEMTKLHYWSVNQ